MAKLKKMFKVLYSMKTLNFASELTAKFHYSREFPQINFHSHRLAIGFSNTEQ